MISPKLSEISRLRELYCNDFDAMLEFSGELGLTRHYAVDIARGRRFTTIPIDQTSKGYSTKKRIFSVKSQEKVIGLPMTNISSVVPDDVTSNTDNTATGDDYVPQDDDTCPFDTPEPTQEAPDQS